MSSQLGRRLELAVEDFEPLRLHVAEGPGAAEMAAAGRTLWARQRSSREKEQALVHIRLCSDGPEDVCEPLSTQVQDVKAANPDKYCS